MIRADVITRMDRAKAGHSWNTVFDLNFQIGGAFPLHDQDCKKLLPETVQDIVAIQWALTHWNQNPANYNAKLGELSVDSWIC
ncbi:hypothetical protein ANCDUO_05881 [Ancylostoma duodenale]|uniref:Uncharacterized protein n=1 Tax=Ancylostoma duodenale TaxID=51022 RepID=A0A0C2D312_9BILA|nr:hypothetical protein ANCDUO_05881 [Ancylostoma duodenale]